VPFSAAPELSPDPLDPPEPADPPDPPDPPDPEPPSSDLELAAAFVRALLEEDRSFFAQPDPLKWTVGVESTFFIDPSVPHDGQNRGPASLMPWITSVRCRQFAQR
jgi:hypothetical protein